MEQSIPKQGGRIFMRKHALLPLVLSLILVSCGTSGSSHPLVGHTFNLSSNAPTATYQTGYDEASHFALIGGVNKDYSSFKAFDTTIRSFFSEGFIKISDTFYNNGYLSYGTSSELTILATLVPSDGKGIDSEKLNPVAESHSHYILSGINDAKEFEFIFASFEKVNSAYSATFTSVYYPDYKDKTKNNTATFAYSFTLA